MSEARQRPAASLFGERVRVQRLALGWSQMRLAEEAGLHFTYVSSVERGERNISLQNILRLAAALGVDAAALVAGLLPGPPKKGARTRRVGGGC
jgi:transcriptional regulator with XRE-family HTH domain